MAALMRAADHGHVGTVDALLERGADANKQTTSGRLSGGTALMWAADKGHVGTVEVLLGRGADANMQSTYGGTALMIAASNGRKEVVDVLLREMLLHDGADVDYAVDGSCGQKYAGMTALKNAIHSSENRVEVVDALLRHGADAKQDGVLTAVACFGRGQIVDLLLQHGAGAGKRREDGNTAMRFACQLEHVQVVHALL